MNPFMILEAGEIHAVIIVPHKALGKMFASKTPVAPSEQLPDT